MERDADMIKMKKFVRLFLVLAFITTLLVIPTAQVKAATLYEECWQNWDEGGQKSSAYPKDYLLAQPFTAISTHEVSTVELGFIFWKLIGGG